MPLFRLTNKRIQQINKTTFPSERALQDLFESNMESLLRVRFVASEFSTGEKHAGRIDTLGLDENDRPTIIEYKWRDDENVINQGLFYLDWLIDHRGDFEIAARKELGKSIRVNWDRPRLILIAQSFSKYDAYAVNRISENIELKLYRIYEGGLLVLEDLHSPVEVNAEPAKERRRRKKSPEGYTIEYHLRGRNTNTVELFRHLQKAITALGENIEETPLKLYVAYKSTRNFCEVEVHSNQIKMFLDIPVSDLDDPKKITRDVSKIGHWGTGETQVILKSINEVEYVTTLIRQSYEYTQ